MPERLRPPLGNGFGNASARAVKATARATLETVVTASKPRKRERLLTTREVTERLRVSPFTVRYFVHRGVLPCVRFTPSSHMRFEPHAVEHLVRLTR
jgi:excisionase family DNA binding protein